METRRIESIAANETVNLEGDTIIEGSIGEGATINFKNGTLYILGKMGFDVKVTVNDLLNINSTVRCKEVGERVTINNINGPIKCERVLNGAYVTTYQGEIRCGFVARGAKLKTANGDIICNDVEQGAEARISSTNGTVRVGDKIIGKASYIHSWPVSSLHDGTYHAGGGALEETFCPPCNIL